MKDQEEEIGLVQLVESEKNHTLLQLLKEMENRLEKKMSEEFGKVNTDLKGLIEKVTILGNKVNDLERKKTRRGGWESEWDGFESVEVVGEKSGDKEEEEEEEERREKEETEKNNSVEDEEESNDVENHETKAEQEEQTLVEEDDRVEVEQEEQALVEEDVGVEKKEEGQTLVEEADGVEKEQEHVTDMVVFVGDVFVDDVFLQLEPEVILLGWKEEGEGSQPEQHVDKKRSRKISTPRLTRNNLPSRFKTNMSPDGRRKKEKPKRTKQIDITIGKGTSSTSEQTNVLPEQHKKKPTKPKK